MGWPSRMGAQCVTPPCCRCDISIDIEYKFEIGKRKKKKGQHRNFLISEYSDIGYRVLCGIVYSSSTTIFNCMYLIWACIEPRFSRIRVINFLFFFLRGGGLQVDQVIRWESLIKAMTERQASRSTDWHFCIQKLSKPARWGAIWKTLCNHGKQHKIITSNEKHWRIKTKQKQKKW